MLHWPGVIGSSYIPISKAKLVFLIVTPPAPWNHPHTVKINIRYRACVLKFFFFFCVCVCTRVWGEGGRGRERERGGGRGYFVVTTLLLWTGYCVWPSVTAVSVGRQHTLMDVCPTSPVWGELMCEVNWCAIYVLLLILPSIGPFGDISKTVLVWTQSGQYFTGLTGTWHLFICGV